MKNIHVNLNAIHQQRKLPFLSSAEALDGQIIWQEACSYSAWRAAQPACAQQKSILREGQQPSWHWNVAAYESYHGGRNADRKELNAASAGAGVSPAPVWLPALPRQYEEMPSSSENISVFTLLLVCRAIPPAGAR